MKVLKWLFISVMVLVLVTGCSRTVITHKDIPAREVDSKYVGSWHSAPFVSAAFTDRYVLSSDGTYKFILNQYDDKRIAYSQEGTWGVNNGKLVLIAAKQINLDKTVVKTNDTYSYSIGNVEEESPEKSPYKYKVLIDGKEFWQYSSESNYWDKEYNEFMDAVK